jgi:uncharacterized protein (DUF488 family)
MNKASPHKTIWTIGHSTHTLDELISMLQSFKIELLADIRNFPGAKRYPHFNRAALEVNLPANNIAYIHLKKLGGRRNPSPHSLNTGWRVAAFRGYADYMETDDFKEGLDVLEKFALQKRIAYMCSEAVWWRCHRSLVSDVLKLRSWTVMHIMNVSKETEHPYTSPAKIIDGKLFYNNG